MPVTAFSTNGVQADICNASSLQLTHDHYTDPTNMERDLRYFATRHGLTCPT